MMRADLHLHSLYSDGTESPRQLAERAKACGLDCFALTDHDSIQGVAEAQSVAKEFGLECVSGVELSTFSTTEIHILGYNFSLENEFFKEKMDEFAQLRIERAKSIISRLAQFRIYLDFESLPQSASVGRLHIANLLVEKGICSSITEAFERYLGAKGIAYIPSKRLTPMQGVELLKKANAVPVIAHPLRFLQSNRLYDLIKGLIPLGLQGLETYYPSHDQVSTSALNAMAEKFGLIATGGSDYHGLNRAGEVGYPEFNLSEKAIRKLGIQTRN